MSAKKFMAESIQSAVARIKDELGADALILSTRRMPKSPRDPYGKDFFEVEAVPSERARQIASSASAGSGKRYEVKELARQDPRLLSGEEGLEALRAELVSIREMLYFMARCENLPGFLQSNPTWFNLYVKLVATGLSEKRAQSFIKQAGEGKAPPGNISQVVLKEISDRIHTRDPFAAFRKRAHAPAADSGKRLAAFIGPTGVGKTTTIAKLAADLSLKQKTKVGLISIDGYRVGAVEQLKAYASIMGLPCLPAFTGEDLQVAAGRLQHLDVILIDTAGLSHMDGERMKGLERILNGRLSISTHLVLSVTAGRANMMDAARKFAALSPETYVFTKLDETGRCGVMIDQVMDLEMPVSFLSNGQKVPEDIVSATRRNMLQAMLVGHEKIATPDV